MAQSKLFQRLEKKQKEKQQTTASRDKIQKRQEECQTIQGQMMQHLKERRNSISQMENERNLTREINNIYNMCIITSQS